MTRRSKNATTPCEGRQAHETIGAYSAEIYRRMAWRPPFVTYRVAKSLPCTHRVAILDYEVVIAQGLAGTAVLESFCAID
jgi:hypothetical protein